MMESDAAEEPGVAEDQGAFRLLQNNVIVFFRTEAGRFHPQFSGHPQMDAEPIAAGEFEEHLFSPGFGAEKTAAG